MTRALKLFPLLFLLSACGIKGDLATPPPVFGSAPATVVTPAVTPAVTPVDVDDDGVGPDEDPFFGPEFEDDFRDDD